MSTQVDSNSNNGDNVVRYPHSSAPHRTRQFGRVDTAQIARICGAMEIEPKELLGKSRFSKKALLRHYLVYLLRKEGVTVDSIAGALARSRTAILKALDKVDEIAARPGTEAHATLQTIVDRLSHLSALPKG